MVKQKCYVYDGQLTIFDTYEEIILPECCIGIGSKNATKRQELPALFKVQTDREARERINALRAAGMVIINDGRGEGYYQPIPEDYSRVKAHYKKELSRIHQLEKCLHAERIWLNNYSMMGVIYSG